jgi:hypothetical protein
MEMEDTDQPALLSIQRGSCPISYATLSEGDAFCLALDAQFMNTRFRVHQIVRLIEFAFTELHITLSAWAVARAFEVGHSAVKRAQLRGYDDPPA